MASVSRVPDAYKHINGWSANDWNSANVSTTYVQLIDKSTGGAYLLDLGVEASSISSASLELQVLLYEQSAVPADIKCSLYSGNNPGNSAALVSTKTVRVSSNSATTVNFSFSGLSLSNVRYLSFKVMSGTDGTYGDCYGPTTGASYSVPALGMDLSATSVYAGNGIGISFSNRQGQNVALVFRTGSTELRSVTASGDELTVSCPESWFTQAGVSGTSMSVSVSGTDTLGRTVSGSFSVKKYQSSPATATSPRSTSVDGTGTITFEWAVNETNGAQSSAELQWSTDGSSWTALGSKSGSGKTLSVAAYKFTSGSVYWRVRATNSYGMVSAWSSAVSFTVSYPELSLAASPASVDMDGSATITVTNRLSRTLTVAIASGSTSLGTKSVSSNSFSVQFLHDWFTTAGISGNTMQVNLTATDNLNRSATVRVAVAKTALTLSLSTASLYTGNQIKLTLGNTAEQSFDITFKYQTTVLKTISGATGDGTRSVTCPADWFTTAGVTSTNMSVSVTVSDTLDRTASASFTLVNPKGLTVTPTAPKSTTTNGAGTINFAWSVSTDWGTQTAAELQWSTDNAVWTDLTSISGSGTTWTAPAVKFPAGTIYWRARATNSFGVVGNWSSSVSFTNAYAAVSQAVPVNSPTSGIISAGSAQTFTITLQASDLVYEPFTVASATFYWRAGDSGDFTAVTMTPSGSNASVTIAAGTFPSGVLQWYAEAVDNTEATRTTSTYTLTALNAEVEATPLSPIATVESGSGPISLRWTYGSLDGSAQAAAELQWSSDGTAWTALASVNGSGTSYDAPASTFDAGTVYWRVRAQNAAETWGPWSDAVTFVCFSAPIVTGVTGDGKPFCTISWQTSGQLAYELEVDGTGYGPYFGADVRSYTLQEYLADGSHTVKVRAQNRYGLWSEWTTATIYVSNIAGPGFFAAASGGVNVVITPIAQHFAPRIITQPMDAQGTSGSVEFEVEVGYENSDVPDFQWYFRGLGQTAWTAWTATGGTTAKITITCSSLYNGFEFRCRVSNEVGEVWSRAALFRYQAPTKSIGPAETGVFNSDTGYFRFYRDGVCIGTSYRSFTDRTAIGTHSYSVIQVLPDGYYTPYNNVQERTAAVTSPMIAKLSGGDFLALRLSESAHRSETFQQQREVAYVQYAGAAYPEAEIGEHKQKSVSFDCAWLHSDAEDADAFEAMLGTEVILKTPGSGIVIGVLEGFERRDPRFYRAYSCTIRQMNWRDFVES